MKDRMLQNACLNLFDNLHYILVLEHVLLAHPLRAMLCRLPPNHCILEVLDKVLVDLVAKILAG